MYKVFGIVLVLLALAIAIVPGYTDCQSQGGVITLANGKTVPMKCHWTGRAEIAAAAPLAVVGVMMVASRRKNTLRNSSIMGIVLAAVVFALPMGIIGTCTTPTMYCNTAMKPALLTMGGVVAGLSIVGLVMSARTKD